MTDKLAENLGKLGFPMMKKEVEPDANAALADVVKSKDMRLWEGFAVVLANSEKRGLVNLRELTRRLRSRAEKSNFHELLALSLALYNNQHLRYNWTKELFESLDSHGKKKYETFLEAFKMNKDMLVAGRKMSAQRLKEVFKNYFLEEKVKLKELLELKSEYGLEFALSQVFSPKQKELFYKKLRNERLTKTEKEYFSRAVKKKLHALANSDLHSLAQKLLQV